MLGLSDDLAMTTPVGPEAQRSNPALEPLAPLIGQWRTTGAHPLVPGTAFHGRTSFEWHERGAFVLMRSEIDEPEIPSAVAVVGSDDAAGMFTCPPSRNSLAVPSRNSLAGRASF